MAGGGKTKAQARKADAKAADAEGDKSARKADAKNADGKSDKNARKADAKAADAEGDKSARKADAKNAAGRKADAKAAGGKSDKNGRNAGGKRADGKDAQGTRARRGSGSSRPPRGPGASRPRGETRRRPGRAVLDRLAAEDEATRAARMAALRRIGLGLGAVVLGLLLVYSVFPVGAILDQHSATNRAEKQLEVLGEENARLEERRDRLQKDEEIERLAREQYGFVLPGEEPYAILPPPAPTTTTTVPEP